MAAGQRDDAPDGRHRYLLAHALERACAGAAGGACEVAWQALASAAPQVDAGLGERVCATVVCNALLE